MRSCVSIPTRPDLPVDDLWRYAKINRVANVMRPYLEVVA